MTVDISRQRILQFDKRQENFQKNEKEKGHMRIGFILLIIVTVITGIIVKIKMKGQMKRSLGRKVEDHELTSLNSWMEVHEKEDRNKTVR